MSQPHENSDGELHDLAQTIAAVFSQRGATLVTAESCTGGWISKTLTDVAGSSSWFECGVVAYSYEAKEALLGVRPETLEQHGAVSRETVIEMVSGVCASGPRAGHVDARIPNGMQERSDTCHTSGSGGRRPPLQCRIPSLVPSRCPACPATISPSTLR